MNNKRLMISLAATIVAFITNICIGFFLTPYIVNHVGSEAYGFVSLANNFTGYAQILTIAINSMAGRFITIAYHQKRYDDLNEYFTSVLYSNIIIGVVLLIPAVLCVQFLERIINISSELITDVKFLFATIFITFFLTLLNSVYSTATFVSNRKDIEAKRNIESYVIKAMVMILLYFFFKPRVLYVGLATISTVGYCLIANIYYTKKLLPEVNVKKKHFSKEKTYELIKSGIWNSISRLSAVLSEGLDLLITNLFIDSITMGVLAVAKMIPGIISTMIGTIGGVFAPNYTIAYAKNDRQELLRKIRQSVLILSAISNVCLVVLIAIGSDFFKLWVPNENAELLQALSIITIAGLSINGGLQCIFNIFTITNKIRANSIASILCSIVNIIVVFVLLNTTELGVFAVAGVSTVTTILRNLLFSVPYAAHCIKIKYSVLYKQIFINLFVLVICSLMGIFAKHIFILDSWIKLFLYAASVALITMVINIVLSTDLKEKWYIINQILKTKRKDIG